MGFHNTEYLTGDQNSLKTTATRLNNLVSTNKSHKFESGFKTARVFHKEAPEESLSDLQNFNNKLKNEVSETIANIEEKLVKMKQKQASLKQEERLTVKQKQEQEASYQSHSKNIEARKKQYNKLK